MGRTSNADQRLMDAALSLIWERSYGAITVDDICRKAEVKKGSFYYFFDSKADLAVAALDRYWREQKPLWDSQFSPTIEPMQRIRAHCDAVYRQQVAIKERTGRVLGCPFCTLGSEICKQDEAIRAKICEILSNKTKYWESAINDAQKEGLAAPGNSAEKARCAMAYFEGLLAQARLHNNAETLASLGDRVCEHMLASRDSSPGKPSSPSAPTSVETTAPPVESEEFDPTKY
ncbi:TetR/AcrR family transcriptional repressor of nem operon [Ereboglobus sp. PH5-5]|nr:TetR/AcrR family transcriptional regulator [Ereboglobus sp. PH5-5]MDF9831836.1 TetR/AcrR family transcriptional repressor of nem operon [Ereboglobus sp. PH5-5]